MANLPTPLTIASRGGGSDLPACGPAFPSIWPAGPALQRDLSTNPGVKTWCVLLPLVDRYIETLDVCISRMFVFMSVVVIVWGSVRIFVV